jgi:hypothetical protein
MQVCFHRYEEELEMPCGWQFDRYVETGRVMTEVIDGMADAVEAVSSQLDSMDVFER